MVAVPVAAVRPAARTVVVPAGVPASSIGIASLPAPLPERGPVRIRTTRLVAQEPPALASSPQEIQQPQTTTSASVTVPLQGSSLSGNYLINIGDLIGIMVWRSPELSVDVRVDGDGKIVLPRGNPVPAAGWTIAGVGAAVRTELKRCCLANPDVILQIKESALGNMPFRTFFFFNQNTNDDRWTGLWRVLSARERDVERSAANMVLTGQVPEFELEALRRARQAIDSVLAWSKQQQGIDVLAAQRQFTNAVRQLDVIEVRFNNGLARSTDLADAYIAAAEALKGVAPPLSDAELTKALKEAATIGTDAGKSNTLLELARAYAFSSSSRDHSYRCSDSGRRRTPGLVQTRWTASWGPDSERRCYIRCYTTQNARSRKAPGVHIC
jgi:hypothetical protein